jgi:SSS family solute:Na+ symporter
LILGSALALFLYPHAITGILSTNSRQVVKRTAALLLAYTFMQGLLGLLGFMAIAASIKASPVYQTNVALPALFTLIFPAWFAGFAFAAIAIGALVPASIMSIGAAHLFTRNIYREYIHPSCSASEESSVAKTTSLVIKAGALAFIVFVPTTFAINLQLLGNVWILQTLPAVFIGLYTNWFHRRALIIGWAAGMILGTWIAMTQNFASVFPLHLGTFTVQLYAALVALLVNLLVSSVLTLLFKVMHIPTGRDLTTPLDYEAYPTLSQQDDLPEALSILTPATSVPPLRSIRPVETMLATPPVVLPPLQTPQPTKSLQSGRMRPVRVERMQSFDGQHGADAKIPEQRRE